MVKVLASNEIELGSPASFRGRVAIRLAAKFSDRLQRDFSIPEGVATGLFSTMADELLKCTDHELLQLLDLEQGDIP